MARLPGVQHVGGETVASGAIAKTPPVSVKDGGLTLRLCTLQTYCPGIALVYVRLYNINIPTGDAMAFKVQTINVDLMTRQANLVAFDQSPPAPGHAPKMIQVNFPFNPPSREGDEKAQAIAEAKAVLQQALNEI